jgi:Uma2 family endonuclease
MELTIPLPPPPNRPFRLLIDSTTWQGYKQVLGALDRAGRRFRSTYCDGRLEIIVPGLDHEAIKTNIARLLETYGLITGEMIEGYGSTTFDHPLLEKGLEPDECYYIGRTGPKVVEGRADSGSGGSVDVSRQSPPDLAVEVDVSRTSIPREPVYAAMGVPELWRWTRAGLRVFHLRRGRYRLAEASLALPELDLLTFESFVKRALSTSQSAAAAAYAKALRRKKRR